MYFAIHDREYVHQRGEAFRVLASKEDFRDFYIPAWKRMVVCFLSFAVAMPIICGVCKLLGWPVICESPR